MHTTPEHATHISNVRNIPWADILVKKWVSEHSTHIFNVRNVPWTYILVKRRVWEHPAHISYIWYIPGFDAREISSVSDFFISTKQFTHIRDFRGIYISKIDSFISAELFQLFFCHRLVFEFSFNIFFCSWNFLL